MGYGGRPGADPLRDSGGGGGKAPPPPKAYSILRMFGCQTKTVHNFMYLAKVYESLVKHEKNVGCSACLFAELSIN